MGLPCLSWWPGFAKQLSAAMSVNSDMFSLKHLCYSLSWRAKRMRSIVASSLLQSFCRKRIIWPSDIKVRPSASSILLASATVFLCCASSRDYARKRMLSRSICSPKRRLEPSRLCPIVRRFPAVSFHLLSSRERVPRGHLLGGLNFSRMIARGSKCLPNYRQNYRQFDR